MSDIHPATPLSSPWPPRPGTPLERPDAGMWSDATQAAIDARDLAAELSRPWTSPTPAAATPGQAAYEARTIARARRLICAGETSADLLSWYRLSAAERADEEAAAQAANHAGLGKILAQAATYKRERDEAREQLAKEDADFDARLKVVDETIAERNRYREALEYILRTSNSIGSRQDARRALAGEPQPWAAPGDGSQ